MPEFKKLNPSELEKAAIVPQVLDNQWVPEDLLSRMITEGKKLDDVTVEREKNILKEWRRSLVYGEQVVVNRAFMFNNAVVVNDYNTSANREDFIALLNDGVIVPYLFKEDGPEQKPTFNVDNSLWNAWLGIVKETKMSCVRLDWGDQSSDVKKLAGVFHEYIKSLNEKDKAETFAEHFNINDAQAFREQLKKVARFAFDKGDIDVKVDRDSIYKEFIAEKDSDVALGLYGKQPFAAEIKQIVDLKYNANLPDALGRYALTPQGSPPRSVLGDLDIGSSNKRISQEDIDEIVYQIKRLAYEEIAGGSYIKCLGDLNLSDVRSIRTSDEWISYNVAVNNVLANPLDLSNGGNDFFQKFASLNRMITKTNKGRELAHWKPTIKFTIFLGTQAICFLMDSSGSLNKFMTVSGAADKISTGATPFVMRLTVDTLTEHDTDLKMSLDFMRGTLTNGRDTWKEIVGQLKESQLEGRVADALAANQSPPENIGE